MAVHRELGCGFHEPVYRAALALELSDRAQARDLESRFLDRDRSRPEVNGSRRSMTNLTCG
jgi:hypothetical protein